MLAVLPVVLVERGEALLAQLLNCAVALRLGGNALRPLLPGSELVVLDVVREHALELVQVRPEFQDLLLANPELGFQVADPEVLGLKQDLQLLQVSPCRVHDDQGLATQPRRGPVHCSQ